MDVEERPATTEWVSQFAAGPSPAERGPRVVVAYDASPGAERAVKLFGARRWPAGTAVRIVSSPSGVGRPASAFARILETRAHAANVRLLLARSQRQMIDMLGSQAPNTVGAILSGRPAEAILDDARFYESDLIVVGSRGYGPLKSMFLGSVSTEIVDQAACSVLVGRETSITRALIAVDDGMTSSMLRRLFGQWPLLADARVRVVGVSAPAPRFPNVALPANQVRSAYREWTSSSTAEIEDALHDVLRRIAADGWTADAEVRVGDPTAEIIAATEDWRADLVVITDSNEGSARRLLLGSTTTNVLHGVTASVLVMRP